jgi:A/G-specific adenine glycosylase
VPDTRDIDGFGKTILAWYARHKRVLPWRDLRVKNDTQRAYLILVSEVMLQQTQVARVEVLYKRFIREFPHLQALAKASNREVITAWRGMGYNSRALRLRDAAKKIVQDFGQVFPINTDELLSIKGIGHYTAAAVRNFAFDLPTPCLDTNIRRILHRYFYGPEKRDGTWKKSDRLLLEVASAALEKAGPPRDWHAALMDFGSLVCTKRTPKCNACPLKKTCEASFKIRVPLAHRISLHREPGREIAGKFVPNRIIRGRIIEFLRDEPQGAALNDIGANVCIDWKSEEHELWLRSILEKLKKDALIRSRGKRFALAD